MNILTKIADFALACAVVVFILIGRAVGFVFGDGE